MSDRLRHLQRQRALLGEHVAWLDSEIARETAAVPSPQAEGKPATDAPALTPAPPEHLPEPVSQADALIEKYAANERQKPADIRRGCFYLFAAAIILLTGAIIAVWLIFYR